MGRKDAHRAIKNLEGHIFSTGETIYLSIALRRRSSLSDEPTNLYVKNLPTSWDNDKLRKVFGAYGQIRQSKVVGDGIAFVRFEDHEQALMPKAVWISRWWNRAVSSRCA